MSDESGNMKKILLNAQGEVQRRPNRGIRPHTSFGLLCIRVPVNKIR